MFGTKVGKLLRSVCWTPNEFHLKKREQTGAASCELRAQCRRGHACLIVCGVRERPCYGAVFVGMYVDIMRAPQECVCVCVC